MDRKPFKHFEDPKSYTELCSGRPGWGNRKTSNKEEVTCKSCLRAMKKLGLAA